MMSRMTNSVISQKTIESRDSQYNTGTGRFVFSAWVRMNMLENTTKHPSIHTVSGAKKAAQVQCERRKTMANNNQKIPYKIYLSENEIPASWYNVRADMKNKPAPLLNPGTLQPMTAEELSAVFCEDLVAQELDNEHAYIPIPQEIRQYQSAYRFRCIECGVH